MLLTITLLGDIVTEYLSDNTRTGPTVSWLVTAGVGLLLLGTLFLPWVGLAAPDKQQANNDWIASRVEAVKGSAAVEELLTSLDVDPQVEFTPAAVIDHEGWRDLRLAIEAGQSLNAWWLLVATEPTLLPRVAAGLQVLLMLLAIGWCVQGMATTNLTLERLIAGGIVAGTIVAAVLIVIGLPRIDTLGHNDSFGLALLMAIVEARPGLGLWLSLVGSVALGGTMFVYLGLGESAWKRSTGLLEAERDPYFLNDRV